MSFFMLPAVKSGTGGVTGGKSKLVYPQEQQGAIVDLRYGVIHLVDEGNVVIRAAGSSTLSPFVQAAENVRCSCAPSVQGRKI